MAFYAFRYVPSSLAVVITFNKLITTFKNKGPVITDCKILAAAPWPLTYPPYAAA